METKISPIAAIDIGTNSFHMVIASVNQKGVLRIIQREKEVIRLGSGSGDMKYLSQDAMDRGVDCLIRFSKLADSENSHVRAIATSAVREALNKQDFISKVKEKSGIDIEVISGVEEARLIYIGAIHALPIYDKKSLIIDIGGGSTETVVGLKGEMLYVNSEKIGAIRTTQKFFPEAVSTPSRVAECRNFIRGEWMPILKKIKEQEFEFTVGTSGTIQNIAMMALGKLSNNYHDFLNGVTVNVKDMLDTIELILSTKSLEKRENILGMDPKRADIILGGSVILETILKEMNVEKIWISPYSLREGAVFDTISKMNDISEFNHLTHLRYETIINLCKRYNLDMLHSNHVQFLSLTLFKKLKHLHGLGNLESELLEAAALLHDIGYNISHDSHHKHSYYIITNSDMPGFTNDEAEIIAQIARYHRKSHPKEKHEEFAGLSDRWKLVVRVLSSILRIAEGLDRRRNQIVSDIEMIETEKKIKFKISSKTDEIPDIEIWGANRRKDLLELMIDREIEFVAN